MFEFITDIIREIGKKPTTPVEVTWTPHGTRDYEIFRDNVAAIAKAQTIVDKEEDPVRKKEMQTLLDNGITDFSVLDE